MCVNTIESENVIFNYFENNPEKREVDFSTLADYVKKIDRKFRDENIRVYFDNTRSSLMNAIDMNCNILKLDEDNNKIELKIEGIPPNQLRLVNSSIPYDVREKYLDFFSKINKELKKNS